ncbi:hypothetical protein PV08_08132 [Exophiala spinifera]|uniref:Amidohydrolase-related domain-containing protein n=1 Tax=Exophiala spinifera TaxID=91928 RepID=A0A0D2B2V7_9EURO|nr:uncharacterized protein PV08_08132 [Exophiala spinifera]KIW12945.1 hypothetical protein PV08_08132 [Exophiala spinifera]
MSFPYPTITVEEHWLSQSVREFYAAKSTPDPYDENGLIGRIVPSLVDFREQRFKSMNDHGVTVQVVSHAPNTLALDPATCTKVNDQLAALIHERPSRFAGFATLPMAEPEAAGEELRRCVQDLGFVGTLVDSNCEGRFYDDDFFWPVFKAAEELDVPVYLHPSANEHTKPLLYDGNYPASVAETLSQYGWGWHNETAIHFLRLYAAGVFDRFPRLQLMLGHLGEMVPFMLDRVDRISSLAWPQLGVKLQRSLRQIWDENVWVTTSGMFYLPQMELVLKQCKPERIIYSVDYPFGHNDAGLEFLKMLKSKQVVTDEVLEGIAYKNAERLLRIKATAG